MKVLKIIYQIVIGIITLFPFLMILFVLGGFQLPETKEAEKFGDWYWGKIMRVDCLSGYVIEPKIEPRINKGMWRKKD